jgi:catechol 2,3-dioxygenase-like lactoylglutathione lyase family enzyme
MQACRPHRGQLQWDFETASSQDFAFRSEFTMPKLDHVAVQVSNLDAAILFYTVKLGMKLLFKTIDEVHHEAFCFLQLEGANLELLQSLENHSDPQSFTPMPIRAPYCPHLAIATDDLHVQLTKLKMDGVFVVKGPLEIPGKVKWAYIHDPDNNIIEFVEWI